MIRRFFYFLILLIAIILISLCVKSGSIARYFLQKQLKKELSADSVVVRRCEFKSLGEIKVTDIAISKDNAFTVKAEDVRVKFNIVHVFKKEVDALIIRNATVDYQKVHIEELGLTIDRLNQNGALSIAKVTYDKAVVVDIKSPVQLNGDELTFSAISAQVFSGQVTGNAFLKIASPPEYHAKLRFESLIIARFVKDFELDKKIDMTGTLGGDLVVSGKGDMLTVLDGELKMNAPGGQLIIKDRRLLENIVARAYLNTAVETLQDYYYNAGVVQLSIQDNSPTADINLEGKQGKRNFKVVYH